MIKSQSFDYREGATVLEGYVAYDDAIHGKRPGVLVVPEWGGVNASTHRRCDQLAEMGYIAVAGDVYGKGIRPQGFEAAVKTSKPYYDDRALLRRRGHACFEALRAHPLTDPKRIAGIGYCFGGITILEVARAGGDVAGVVCFHTQLLTSMPATTPGSIKAKILVLHGADDPVVPQKEIDDFIAEMRVAKADWQLISYGNAVHSYTNPEIPLDPSGTKPAAYEPNADRRSWTHMQDFFREIF